MKPKKPTTQEWRTLYEKAVQVLEMAPWTWMVETEIFGVQNPETGEPGFVSVMGNLGEHLAIAIYLGERALYDFWAVEGEGPFGAPETILEIPQLQASFENREQLGDRDRSVMSDLRLKFHGKNAWPMFRHYGYGLFPWYIDQPQARFLIHALEQVLDVAPRVKTKPSLLDPGGDELYLVRVAHEQEGALTWHDEIRTVPPPEPAPIRVQSDSKLVERFKQLPQRPIRIELDLFMVLGSPVRDGKGERPYYPYMLLPVDASSGFIFSSELLRPLPSLEAMRASVPMQFVRQFVQHKFRPAEVAVRSSLLYELLNRLAEVADLRLIETHTLPELDRAKAALTQHLDRSRGGW